jgi:HEPN domain-containing protein
MERAIDWMRQAERDLERAKLDVELGFYEWACFTSQQSAEKAVKAVFQKLNKSLRGHSLLKMLEELRSELDVPENLFGHAKLLDRYYIEARYPNSFPAGSPYEFFDLKLAQQAYDSAREIVEWCRDIIGKL